jgi:hypothetical protein
MLINVKHIYCKTKIGSTSEIVEYLYESYSFKKTKAKKAKKYIKVKKRSYFLKYLCNQKYFIVYNYK